MDPLALLSELHGNGRETYEKLSMAGWTDIRIVADANSKDLARVLGMGERSAKKFQREARAMLQGNIFRQQDMPVSAEAVEPASRKAPVSAASEFFPACDSFKLKVVELVAKRFL